jgi:predicted CXXCH cytochrome family protein
MKKIISILLVLAAISWTATAQITGSPHDFSSMTWNSTGEICIVCHTPHNAVTLPQAPLWNHMLSSVSTYTLYDNSISATFNATTAQPNGASKLCLSCHDGTIALDNFGTVTTGTNYILGINNLGTGLSNDHPISFTYNAALATTDGGLFNPVTQLSGLGGTIQNDLLIANQMQCSSCHDVHNKYNQSHLLKLNNAGSALCLTCHDK